MDLPITRNGCVQSYVEENSFGVLKEGIKTHIFTIDAVKGGEPEPGDEVEFLLEKLRFKPSDGTSDENKMSIAQMKTLQREAKGENQKKKVLREEVMSVWLIKQLGVEDAEDSNLANHTQPYSYIFEKRYDSIESRRRRDLKQNSDSGSILDLFLRSSTVDYKPAVLPPSFRRGTANARNIAFDQVAFQDQLQPRSKKTTITNQPRTKKTTATELSFVKQTWKGFDEKMSNISLKDAKSQKPGFSFAGQISLPVLSEKNKCDISSLGFEQTNSLENREKFTFHKIYKTSNNKDLEKKGVETNWRPESHVEVMTLAANFKTDFNTSKKVLKPLREVREGPDDHHFRIAESQFYRLMNRTILGNKYKIKEVHFFIDPQLQSKFETKKQGFKAKYGNSSPESESIFCFHGTKSSSIVEAIMNENFKPSNIGKFGAGVYFSEQPEYTFSYGGVNHLILAKVLPGKTLHCTDTNMKKLGLTPGYDSHGGFPQPDGTYNEVVIFNVDQILPCYVIHFQ